MSLLPHEVELIGTWSLANGHAVADETCNRIKSLTGDFLEELARDESGWSTVYRDPSDGRLWELSYPLSSMHGGGPPRLAVISLELASQKYGLRVGD